VELTLEQKRAIAKATARKRLAETSATAAMAPQAASGPLALPSEALSGVNEGLANFLSLPNSIELGLRSIGPAIGNAFGGEFEMPTQSILPDAGADYRRLASTTGAIKPPGEDAPAKFVRRVGEEVGANIIPAAGTPARVASALASVGSGVGAATAEAFAPDNPLAEFAGQMLGGGSVVGAANAIEKNALRKAAPSVDDLKAQAGSLYDAAEARGITFAQPAVKTLADDVASGAISDGIDPTLHPRATAALKRLQDAGSTGMTVADAQTLRRVLSGAAKDPMNPDEQRIVSRMLDTFDQFVGQGAPELAAARGIYHQAKKGEMIETAIELAGSRAGQFSGSGFENALRTEFRAIDRKIIKGQLKGLSEEEIAAIRKVANGGPIENIARYIGKLAPSGAVSFGVGAGVPFAVGNAFGGPVPGAIAAASTMGAGLAGRHVAQQLTSRNAQIASALMRRGGGSAPVPYITPSTMSISRALMLGQAANQNDPASIYDALLPPSSRATVR